MNDLPLGCYLKAKGRESNHDPLRCESNILTITPPGHLACKNTCLSCLQRLSQRGITVEEKAVKQTVYVTCCPLTMPLTLVTQQ